MMMTIDHWTMAVWWGGLSLVIPDGALAPVDPR